MGTTATTGQPVAVDFQTVDPEKRQLLTTIPYCCTSKKKGLACHAYNCGNSNVGCIKFCANN
jgi:hypothetical protein